MRLSRTLVRKTVVGVEKNKMASGSTDPIVIASDDESDNDDVVLVKEEIEVDSEDVIFLSETKPTPKCDQTLSIPVPDSVNGSKSRENSLNRSVSLTTCTNQLSLDDVSDPRLDSSGSLGDAGMPNSSVCPLDLSSKSVDLHVKSASSDPSLSDNGGSGDNPQGPESFFMLLMGDDSVSQNAGTGLDSGTGIPSSANYGATTSNVSDSDHSVTSGRHIAHGNSTSMACDSSSSSSSLSTSDWSKNPFIISIKSTSADQKLDDNSVNKDSISSSTTLCKTPVPKTKSEDLTVIGSTLTSQISIAGKESQPQDTMNAADSATQTWTSNSDTNRKNSLTSAISIDANVAVQMMPKSTADLSDPFQTSHALLSSLDLTLTSTSQALTGSGYGSKIDQQTSVNIGTQSGFSTGSGISSGQSSMFRGGLLGGSCSNITMPVINSAIPLGFHNSFSCVSTNVSSSNSNVDQSNTCFYNSLTLPLSLQDRSLISKSKHKIGTGMTRDVPVHGKSHSSNALSDRSPSPQGSHHLPPKKQRRCYSDTAQDSSCTNCDMSLFGEKASQCPNGHSTCTRCLEERVKLVLTGRAKESVKCLNKSCDSYYPISELRQSLPSFVVEILEEKLDQEYVNCISEMIMKQVSVELEQDSASGELEQMQCGYESRHFKKYEDCPGHWEAMDEREVNKNGYVLVPLEPNSSEYETVTVRFFESMVDHNVEVTAVHRVQNPILWKYYTVKKSEMLRDNGGFSSVVEGQLFHGTSTSAVENICRKGFDWRLCGKHGTMYGQGSYFAVNASYSHQYTDLRRPHGPFRPTLTLGNPGLMMTMHQMVSPLAPLPPHGLNFSLPPPTIPIVTPSSPVTPSNQFRPINLSHNATVSTNPPIGLSSSNSQTGLMNQSGSSQHLQQNITKSSSIQSGSISSSTASAPQPGTSGTSHPWQQIYNDLQKSADIILAQRKKSQLCPGARKHSCSKKILPKPLAIRTISGLASTALVTNLESSPEPERPKARSFLARVLVGKYTVGNPKLRKPPPLYPNSDQFGKCFDSCVDNEENPKIFVIFDSTQAYPEYMLEYSYGPEKPYLGM